MGPPGSTGGARNDDLPGAPATTSSTAAPGSTGCVGRRARHLPRAARRGPAAWAPAPLSDPPRPL